ncbi:unnamed protein product [Brassica oleracea]
MSPEVMRDEHPMRSQSCTALGSSCGSFATLQKPWGCSCGWFQE